MTGPGVHDTPICFEAPPSLEAVLAVLRDYQPAAREIGVELVGVVGSVARGEARADSDVDIAYDVVGPGLSLFKLGGLLMDLQDAIGRPVDLIDRERLKPERREFMEKTMVAA